MIRSILSFLVSNSVFDATWHLVLWASGGVLLGFFVGLGLFLFIRARGGYGLEGWWGGGWRALTGVLTILVFAFGTGYVGLCEGAWRGVRHVMKENTVFTGAYTYLGKAEAIFLAGVYYAAIGIRDHPGITPGEEAALVGRELDAFLEGRQEIRARDLEWQMKTIGREVIDQSIGVIESRTESVIPYLGRPEVKRHLRPILEDLGGSLAHDQAHRGIRYLRLDVYLQQIFDGMGAEAARSGSPDGLTYREMADYLGRWSLVDWITRMVRAFLRQQQAAALLVMGGTLTAPVLLFWVARIVKRGMAKARTALVP